MACSAQQLLLLDAVLDMLLESHATGQHAHLGGVVLDNRPGAALTTLGFVFQRLGWPKNWTRPTPSELLLTFAGDQHNSRIMAKGGALWAVNDHMTAHTALILHAARASVRAARHKDTTP
jgi:hypothetical protein